MALKNTHNNRMYQSIDVDDMKKGSPEKEMSPVLASLKKIN